MAMINCPDCGQEVSDKAKKCVHCGKVLIEDVSPIKFCSDCGKQVSFDATECPYCGCPLEDNGRKIKKQNTKKVKKIAIPIAIIAVIGIIVFAIVNHIGSSLNEDEQLAYKNAVELKNMLKNPDSFKLYDEFFIIKRYDDDGNVECTYTVFKYGGANSYGAITTDEAIFKNDKYIMDYADGPDEDDANYREQLEVKIDLSIYMLKGDSDTWKKVDIDVEKIKKKMGIE